MVSAPGSSICLHGQEGGIHGLVSSQHAQPFIAALLLELKPFWELLRVLEVVEKRPILPQNAMKHVENTAAPVFCTALLVRGLDLGRSHLDSTAKAATDFLHIAEQSF